MHKIQFLLANPRPVPMRSIQCNPVDTIQPIRSSQYYLANTIQTIQTIRSIRYDQSSVSSEGNPPTRPSLIRKTHPHLPQLLIFHPPHRPLLPDMCSLPLLFHLLITSLLKIEISPSPRPFFGLSNCKSHREILGGNSEVLDGVASLPVDCSW